MRGIYCELGLEIRAVEFRELEFRSCFWEVNADFIGLEHIWGFSCGLRGCSHAEVGYDITGFLLGNFI